MRFLLINHIENALHSLRMNRSRTVLTIIGLTVGVASITAILALAGGVTSVVDHQISSIGGNIAVIRPGAQQSIADNLSDVISNNFYRASTLSENDLATLERQYPDLDVAPIMMFNSTLKSARRQTTNTQVIATTPALEKTTRLVMDRGQFIDSTTNDYTAVVGSALAVNLFGTDNPLGQNFEIHGQTFTVIGVLKAVDNPFNYDGADFDNAMIIDLAAGKNIYSGRAQIQQFTIKSSSPAALKEAVPSIKKTLLESHGENDFSIVVGRDIALATNGMFVALASVLSAIAAISLVVGGIGVMNIMLVGVAERTREIGIRKSVGASSFTIVVQFLVEAVLMSIGGGILGFTLGIVAAFVATTQFYFMPVINWQIAGIALATSLVIGVIFGIYPAIRAARKNPIDSLR